MTYMRRGWHPSAGSSSTPVGALRTRRGLATPDDAAIERGARALWAHYFPPGDFSEGGYSWADVPVRERAWALEAAAVVLAAVEAPGA